VKAAEARQRETVRYFGRIDRSVKGGRVMASQLTVKLVFAIGRERRCLFELTGRTPAMGLRTSLRER
jgi:hypothetical protein